MQRAIAGHEGAMLEFFPQLLSLAQQLLRAAAEGVQAAGAQLYCLLFKHFTPAYNQQEVRGGVVRRPAGRFAMHVVLLERCRCTGGHTHTPC